MESKNKTRILIGVLIILLISCFFLGRCTKNCEVESITTTITTPEKKGDFPISVSVPHSSPTKTAIQFKDTLIFIPQVNQELIDKYLALESENDSNKRELERFKLYTEGVATREYNTPFEDENIKINIYSKTQGTLLATKPEYTIKSQTLTTSVNIPKPKEQVFSLNIGASATTTKDLNKIDPAINLQLVGKRGAILGTSYSVDGVIGVSYTIPLFSIKK